MVLQHLRMAVIIVVNAPVVVIFVHAQSQADIKCTEYAVQKLAVASMRDLPDKDVLL